MAPETFNETVAAEEATFVPGSVNVMVPPGETADGDQVAVLRGLREGEVVPRFSIVLATNTDPQNKRVAFVRMSTGAPDVRHGSHSGRSPLVVKLPYPEDPLGRHLFFGDNSRPAQLGRAVIGSYIQEPAGETPAPAQIPTTQGLGLVA